MKCDVIVVGSGPAGSTAATFLARKGWSVALIEKDHHPRFHIGESLLPMNLPILQRLGLLEAVADIGVRKPGADFPSPTPQGYQVFRFDRALGSIPTHAYQVRREDFDRVLFENAVTSGACASQGCKATTASFGEDGVRIEGVADDGVSFRCDGRYLVDASGRDTLLGNQLQLKRRDRRHQSAAVFAHFHGVERRTGEDAGNISIYRFEQGWIWLIPLPNGVTSLGAVCWPDYLKRRRGSTADFLLQTLRSVAPLGERMRGAAIIGAAQATGNYSYSCRRISGRRWIMAGDAYAFVDPIFSSGVYLAMHAAEQAAEVVDGALREPDRERGLQRRYQKQVRHGIKTMSWFIYRFTSPAMRKLFGDPRNVLQVEQAIISMLSGDVHRSNGVLWRLKVFKAIYWIAALGNLGDQVRSYRFRRGQARAQFAEGTSGHESP